MSRGDSTAAPGEVAPVPSTAPSTIHPSASDDVEDPQRRRLLTQICLWGSAAIGALLGLPIIGHLLGPLIRPAPDIWRDLGPIAQYVVGETVLMSFEESSPLPWAGRTARTAVYVRRLSETNFVVFWVNCTHLNCPVNWQPQAELFLCPCHGGVYYADGTVAAGPPPRPLFHYESQVVNDRLQIRTGTLPVA